jgi:hypothetical protein
MDKDDMNDDFEGRVTVPLKDLESQIKIDEWYELLELNGNPCQGKIHLKIQFLWSKYSFYQNLLDRLEIRRKNILESIEDLNKYFDLFITPFGLILHGGINELIENKILENDDILKKSAVNNFEQTNRLSKLLRTSATNPADGLRKSNLFFNPANSNQIAWTPYVKIIMAVVLFLTLISLFDRSDFINVN